jgi:four helix bundle protein
VSNYPNIAEGAGRKGKKEFIQFLYIALGSVAELETQVILSQRLQFVDSVEEHIKKMEKINKCYQG